MIRTRRPPRLAAFAVAAAALVSLAGCATSTSPAPAHTAVAIPSPAVTSAADCSGVFVTVQYGLLGGADSDACVPASGLITAAAALTAAGFETQGTAKYGDAVVCRVNDAPSATHPISVPGQQPYTETCQGMPAAFAYWAMWVRSSATGAWGYAENGVTTQQLRPGQALGLKFTTGTDTTPPRG